MEVCSITRRCNVTNAFRGARLDHVSFFGNECGRRKMDVWTHWSIWVFESGWKFGAHGFCGRGRPFWKKVAKMMDFRSFKMGYWRPFSWASWRYYTLMWHSFVIPLSKSKFWASIRLFVKLNIYTWNNYAFRDPFDGHQTSIFDLKKHLPSRVLRPRIFFFLYVHCFHPSRYSLRLFENETLSSLLSIIRGSMSLRYKILSNPTSTNLRGHARGYLHGRAHARGWARGQTCHESHQTLF